MHLFALLYVKVDESHKTGQGKLTIFYVVLAYNDINRLKMT